MMLVRYVDIVYLMVKKIDYILPIKYLNDFRKQLRLYFALLLLKQRS